MTSETALETKTINMGNKIYKKVFEDAFPVLKPYLLNRDVKEYITDHKTGERTRI